MAGSKRAKLKKAFNPPTPFPPTNGEDDLLNDLMAHLDSKDKQVQAPSAAVLNREQHKQIDAQDKRDPKSRWKARQARKAAALAQTYTATDPAADARLQIEADIEEKNINRICDELHVQIHEIEPDGHCLYSAVADQLALLGILPPPQAHYRMTRLAASNYIFGHPHDFLPFLPLNDEDGPGAETGLMTPQQFERYCASIRDTAVWGGEPEILALSRAFNVPIHVVQSGSPPVVVHVPYGSPLGWDLSDKRVVRISYHRRMYGLGEHYNSLRPKSSLAKISSTIQSILS